MFEWTTGNAQLEVVTLNENNITLNQNAASHFRDSHFVLVGFDENNHVAIKPVKRKDLELNAYPKENLHKISLGKGYAKINNKALLDLMSNRVGIAMNGQKIVAAFREKEEFLTFDLSTLKKEGEAI